MNKDNLKGSDDPKKYKATTEKGNIIDPASAIFPIFTNNNTNKWRLIGTGFFISHNSLFISAQHVLTDVVEDDVPISPLRILHFYKENHFMNRQVSKIVVHNNYDFGIGSLFEARHNTTGDIMTNKSLTLSLRVPEIGEPIFTYAYPNTAIDNNSDKITTINVKPEFYSGVIKEFFPNGRDKVLMPSKCYRSDMIIHGGASGGPVFDIRGNVIGINSTGFQGIDESFITSIHDIFNITIDNVILPGKDSPQKVSLHELSTLGLIKLVNPPS